MADDSVYRRSELGIHCPDSTSGPWRDHKQHEKLQVCDAHEKQRQHDAIYQAGVEADLVSTPKLKWDLTVNIPVIVMIACGVLSIGGTMTKVVSQAESIADHENRIRSLEGNTAVLARIDERLKNIEQRLDVK